MFLRYNKGVDKSSGLVPPKILYNIWTAKKPTVILINDIIEDLILVVKLERKRPKLIIQEAKKIDKIMSLAKLKEKAKFVKKETRKK